MLKPFLELYDLDISAHTEKRENLQWKEGSKEPKHLEYLPWHKCLYLLYANGAEKVVFEPIYTAEGHSVHYMPKVVEEAKKWGVNGYCPEVRVRVTIDDQAREFNYPLINGATVIKMEEISQQKVATAQKRAYVKGVAQMTGLGLRLWEKEEPDAPIETNDEAHSVQVCSNRIRRKYAEAVKRVGDEKAVRERIEFDRKVITEKQLQMIFWALSHAAELEHQLVRMK